MRNEQISEKDRWQLEQFKIFQKNIARLRRGNYESAAISTGQTRRRTRESERIGPKNSQVSWMRVGDMGRK